MLLSRPGRFDCVDLLTIKTFRVWFYQKNPMAFAEGDVVVASENWHKSGVMGQVLNEIEPDKKKRLARDDFLKEIQKFEDRITPFFIHEPETLMAS